MVLVDGTVSTGAARVGQVSTNRSFEEALAALARELSVVLPGALVAADDALHAGRRRKSAGDVTTRRRVQSMLMTATTTVVVVAAAAASGRRHLLDEVLGPEHPRHRRWSSAAVRGGSVNLQ